MYQIKNNIQKYQCKCPVYISNHFCFIVQAVELLSHRLCDAKCFHLFQDFFSQPLIKIFFYITVILLHIITTKENNICSMVRDKTHFSTILEAQYSSFRRQSWHSSHYLELGPFCWHWPYPAPCLLTFLPEILLLIRTLVQLL